ENPAFYDFLSAEEYLRFVGGVFGMSLHVLNERIEESLKLLELWDVRKRPVRSFSKGMVQRVGLAQVMIHDPDVYILDEPMSGLDPLGRALVKDIIIGLKKRGKSVFFSTHITDDVEKVCDRVAVINKGRLVAVDDVDNIMQRGIEGYCVTVVEKDGAVKDYYVGKSDLQEFILSSAADSKTIERIESRRKDMEAFFLEMVSR
ncbi:MAG TPA: ABC transporter ATP-binding protein, partial [Deltaproteobacteria bacterium]|nr:ABC transporter ATP-binding protein [Deltaproteobacteria bacterium]